MKLAIVFDVPDGQADTYADMTARMIKRHQFAQEQAIKHWSFDLEMRPVAAALIPASGGDLAEAIRDAEREIDQEHPWLPGGVFKRHEGLKPLMLWVLNLLK